MHIYSNKHNTMTTTPNTTIPTLQSIGTARGFGRVGGGDEGYSGTIQPSQHTHNKRVPVARTPHKGDSNLSVGMLGEEWQ